MRFKEVAQDLSEREILGKDVFARKLSGEFQAQLREEGPQLNVNVFQLMDAFKRIIDQKHPGVQLRFRLEKLTVKEKMEFIIMLLKDKGAVYFRDLFEEDRTLSECVVTFLAVLELVLIGIMKILQMTPESDIRLVPSFSKKDGNGNGKPA
jgi:segregation and condensation protein A